MRGSYGVGKSSNTTSATKSALAQALEKGHQGPGRLTFAMIYWGSEHDPALIADAIKAEALDVPIIGCSTDGEITSEGLTVDSVSVILVYSERLRAKAHVVERLSRSSIESGAGLAGTLKADDARVLFLLPDGLTGNGSAVIHGCLDVLGPDFVIAGGTAGDRGKFEKTWQLCNDQVYTDALVGLMLYSDKPVELGFGVQSGWRPIGVAKQVTKADGNIVYRIEDESALAFYSRYLGEKADQLPAIGVEYPFGLIDESGRVDTRGIRDHEEYILLRAPMSVDREAGAVRFAAEIPEGARIKMTRAKSADIIEGSREAARRALRRLSGPPEMVFFFSCMARRVVLGRKTDQEIFAAQEVFGKDVPLAGFYTYGEIANCGDTAPVCRFHNETATFLAMRE
jgi:hypothetical protein